LVEAPAKDTNRSCFWHKPRFHPGSFVVVVRTEVNGDEKIVGIESVLSR